MTRIRRAFESRFRQLLHLLGARQTDKGIRWLSDREAALRAAEGLTPSEAFARVHIRLARQVHTFLKRCRPNQRRREALPPILCDAGLGGFARWLRALGYQALWIQDITDEDLLLEAQKHRAMIITTDSGVMERKQIKNGEIEAYWVPPSLTRFEQLDIIRAELDLPTLDSRCMRCGGELELVDPEKVKEKIPPLTYKWIKEYWQCQECDQLFWHGAHWKRINRKLDEVTRSGVATK
ncbi:MAG: Mut7-C RNAse domain-containing protein [Verrucomicrobiales bacterium]